MGLTMCAEPIDSVSVTKVWFEKLSRRVGAKELNEKQISEIMGMLSSVQELISSEGEIKGDFYPIDPKWPCYTLVFSHKDKEEQVTVRGNIVMFEDGSIDEVLDGKIGELLDDMLVNTQMKKQEVNLVFGRA